jgi:hypothetical protein
LHALIGGLPFTAEQVQEVAAGKTVATPVIPVSEGELAIGLACLIEADAVDSVLRVPPGHWLVPQDNLIAAGTLEEGGSPGLGTGIADMLAAGEGAKYAQAKAGGTLNLSAAELERLAATAQGTPDALPSAVYDLVLGRFHEYRAAGLSALAPYARAGGADVDPGSQLRQSVIESAGAARYFPSVHATLLNYPATAPDVNDEGFHWMIARLGERDAVLLAHTLSAHRGRTDIIVTRAFYVSHSLNVLQAGTVVHPVAEGTLFLYVYRAWLDRVRGFAGTFAAGVARDIMTREMRELARLTGACG